MNKSGVAMRLRFLFDAYCCARGTSPNQNLPIVFKNLLINAKLRNHLGFSVASAKVQDITKTHRF